VTGVSRRAGIGFAIARQFVAEGAHVFAHGWTPHDATQPWGADEETPSALHALGDRVQYVEADFADPDTPHAVVSAARGEFGHVDLLIVNHARSGRGRLAEVTASELDAFLHENVRASILLVKEFAAQHDERPGGRVVLMTSGQHLAPMARGRLRDLEGSSAPGDEDACRRADRPRHHREYRQSWPDRHRVGHLPPRSTPWDAARPLGPTGGCCTPHSLALQ